jgi:hypothetical protein
MPTGMNIQVRPNGWFRIHFFHFYGAIISL